jgi:hypothetical protein
VGGVRLDRVLDRASTVYAACGITLLLGLLFIFVRAPHPWGHEGFDHYHQLALGLATGRGFPTMEVPWGYALFLAAFYRMFGDHPSIPLVVQAALNACLPALVFVFATAWLDRRTAAAAAVLTGVFSFNTVYASTQASDAVCTVIFMTAITVFASALARGSQRQYAVTGVLAGLAPQFRPNLVLIPLLLGGYAVAVRRRRGGGVGAIVLVASSALALAPWIARNYWLTRQLVPASVHSGVQLWYGTLQVGPYLHSRAYNPRSIFETPVFDYTSLDDVPIIFSARAQACADGEAPVSASLVYWSDQEPAHRAIAARLGAEPTTFEVPPPRAPAVLYYYFATSWSGDPDEVRTSPPGSARTPGIYFVSHDHLGDLDLHGDLLDSFDLTRMMRHVAWHEPLPFANRLAAAGIRDEALEDAARALAPDFVLTATGKPAARHRLVADFTYDDRQARLRFFDGSEMVVPRTWRSRITDVEFSGTVAGDLMTATIPLAVLRHQRERGKPEPPKCGGIQDVTVNAAFYRQEPHLLRRYLALAWDNITRTPFDFAIASVFRAFRLFVIRGSDDRRTTQQFEGSRLVYALATAASLTYALLFVCGGVVAWRRGNSMTLPLLLVLYVPLTIAPMLTNMRYTVTTQPLVFMFVAVAVTTLLERARLLAVPRGARDREGTETTRQI